MTKNLDHELEQRLFTVTLGRATFVSLAPIHLEKIPGVEVYIDAGAKTLLTKRLESQAGVDMAQELGISTKKISRLRKALGIPLEPREGTSRTTAWRRQRAAEAAKEK